MEKNNRTLAKTLSWRIFAILITFSILYVYTDKILESTTLTFLINGIKTVAYFLHEKLWTKVIWGYEVR